MSERARVRFVPAMLAELPAPLSVHWLFCLLPPPGATELPPVEASSFAKVNRFVAGL